MKPCVMLATACHTQVEADMKIQNDLQRKTAKTEQDMALKDAKTAQQMQRG